MKFLLLLSAVLCTTLLADGDSASIKLSDKECLHYPYAHTLGGTLHSRTKAANKRLKLAQQKVPYSEKEALKLVQKRYPTLGITALSLTIKNCFVYFKADHTQDYFDAGTLTLIQAKEL